MELPELLGRSLQADVLVDSDVLGALTATEKRWNARGACLLEPPGANKEGMRGISKDDDKDGKIAHPQKPGEFIEARYIVYTAGRDMDPATWEDNITSVPDLPRKPFWSWE
ncbi:hypothetical protein [Verrucomicrobium spinosum]|uniref:hypothetical protein n=2 Tax=Verrucomicrobium spinosum TaxID=2736 RepID=UPI0012F6D5FC|nr:hypothetical protein [Verrucomicrobium spinosum]